MSDAEQDTGSGIIGAQQATADARARERLDAQSEEPVTAPEEQGTLAIEALKVAAYHNDEPDAVTQRAGIYLDWLKKNG